jgi:hypothetical protein
MALRTVYAGKWVIQQDDTYANGATAGTPGTWTSSYGGGVTPPASVANLIAHTPNNIVATPQSKWTTGQYVQTGTAGGAGQAYWSGTAWVAGTAP